MGGAEIYRNTQLDPERRCYPGGFFDPLNLADPAAPERAFQLKTAEIKHGRLAMVAALGGLPLFGRVWAGVSRSLDWGAEQLLRLHLTRHPPRPAPASRRLRRAGRHPGRGRTRLAGQVRRQLLSASPAPPGPCAARPCAGRTPPPPPGAAPPRRAGQALALPL
jgi:hypothetical protein